MWTVVKLGYQSQGAVRPGDLSAAFHHQSAHGHANLWMVTSHRMGPSRSFLPHTASMLRVSKSANNSLSDRKLNGRQVYVWAAMLLIFTAKVERFLTNFPVFLSGQRSRQKEDPKITNTSADKHAISCADPRICGMKLWSAEDLTVQPMNINWKSKSASFKFWGSKTSSHKSGTGKAIIWHNFLLSDFRKVRHLEMYNSHGTTQMVHRTENHVHRAKFKEEQLVPV